jgi:non-heme chloroperoxidase
MDHPKVSSFRSHSDAGALTAKLVKKATLKVYPGFPHGMPIIHADLINKDLLAFIHS